MKKRTVKLPEDLCCISWIIENQDDVRGCEFVAPESMKQNLLDESLERGNTTISENKTALRMFIPAEIDKPDDNDAEIIMRHRNDGWIIADIDCIDVPKRNANSRRSILFGKNPEREEIHFI